MASDDQPRGGDDRLTIDLVTLERQRFTPLALGYLHAQLVADADLRDRVDVRISVESASDDHAALIDELIRRRPAVLGLSVYVWNALQSYALARAVKERSPGTLIVVGGPEVGPQAADVLADQVCVDVVVLGEGEETFRDLVGARLQGAPYAGIPGLACRGPGGEIVSEERPPMPSLDALASPFQLGTLPRREGEVGCIETHRGCSYACRFCFYHKAFGATRFLEEERVRTDLGILSSWGVKRIYLMDPTFNESLERAKAICQLIIDMGLPEEMRFHTEIRAERLDAELVGLMKRAGFRMLEVGLQSSSAELLKDMKRGHQWERFEEGVRLLNEAQLFYELQLIFAVPGDTWESYLTSLRYVLDRSPHVVTVALLRLLPGTEYRSMAPEYGLQATDGPPHFVTVHPNLSSERILQGRLLGEFVMGMWNHHRVTAGLLCQELGADLVTLAEQAALTMRTEDIPPGATLEPRIFMPRPASELFVERLEAATGRDLSFYRTCVRTEWAGKYEGPADATDANEHVQAAVSL